MPEVPVEKIIAFDFGLRRIGVALGISLTETATPLATVTYQNQEQLWKTLDDLISEWRPQQLLLGHPDLDAGDDHPLAKPISKFANQLSARYQLNIELVDESNTSIEANERLKQQRQMGRKKRIDKSEIDRQAAALILENWFATR